MEGGTLFNPGFLGSNFNWWIGQIADDSTWRDNQLPGKFESKYQVPGWGKRYKVRIIGLHDQGNTVIPADQLPWAQVMYPVTAGGGQGGSGQTSNLRQGMFVFGFFLDGQDQQVPVIMGVLGNNAQTQLATTWEETNKVTNENAGSLATSGFAQGAVPYVGKTKPVVPDGNLVVEKPKSPEDAAECAPIPPGTKLDKYGLPFGKATKKQLADIQSAAAEATLKNIPQGEQFDNFIKQKVAEGIKARCQAANSPTSAAQPGATIENVDAVHLLTNADVKRFEVYIEKTSLMSPCDPVQSAMKSMQIAIENLTKKINKILNAVGSYIDAVSSVLGQIQDLIANFACEVAKYLKILFDKIMEYVLKKINCALKNAVSAIPPNRRHQFAMIKEKMVELIKCLYSKITNGICGQIEDFLNNELEKQQPYLKDDGNGNYKNNNIEMCAVEELVGSVIAANMNDMTSGLDAILKGINDFLSEIQSYVAEASSALSAVKGVLGSLNGSISSALTFENLKLNLFGCDLAPNCSPTDFYTIQSGGGGQPQSQLPNPVSVDKAVNNPKPIKTGTGISYAQPTKDTPKVTYKNPK